MYGGMLYQLAKIFLGQLHFSVEQTGKKNREKQIRSPLGAHKLFSPYLIIKKRKTAKRFLLRIHLEINVHMKIMMEFEQKQIDRCRDAYYDGG